MKDWTEAKLTQKLLETARAHLQGSVCLKHNDSSTSGMPDASITWGRFTTWIEVKYANPSFKSTGLQELTCCRLERAGRCIYVIYDAKRESVSIVAPKDLGSWQTLVVYSSAVFDDHRFIVEYIRQSHLILR